MNNRYFSKICNEHKKKKRNLFREGEREIKNIEEKWKRTLVNLSFYIICLWHLDIIMITKETVEIYSIKRSNEKVKILSYSQ